MDPTELHLARLSQQMALAAAQAALAYHQAQAGLDLAQVLSAERLTSEDGRAESRKIIAALAELTSRHKHAFSNFLTHATSQLVAATAELPAEKRDWLAQRFLGSVNWNLAVQSKFYEGRERWIAAAAQVLGLADQHDDELWLEDGTLVFACDTLLDEFSALVAVMDKVHEEEVVMFAERQARIAAAAARLGAKA